MEAFIDLGASDEVSYHGSQIENLLADGLLPLWTALVERARLLSLVGRGGDTEMLAERCLTCVNATCEMRLVSALPALEALLGERTSQ